MVRSHARRSGISSVDDLESESVSTEKETVDSPDEIPPDIGGTKASVLIRAPSTARAIALQNQDDSQGNGPGKASVYWYSDAGEKLASMVAHPTDQHWSLYTRSEPLNGTSGTLEKRLDVEMGDTTAGDPRALWQNIGENRLGKSASNAIVFERSFDSAQAAIDHAEEANIGYVILEPRDITEALTISKAITVVGQGTVDGAGTRTRLVPPSTGSVTLSGSGARLMNCDYDGGDPAIRVTGNDCVLDNLLQSGADGNGIEVAGDRVLVRAISRFGAASGDNIVLESGTSDGIVDQCRNTGAITDNGSNVLGTNT